jgi:hypothetical protein
VRSVTAAGCGTQLGLHQLSITGQWYTAHVTLPAVLAGLPQLTKLQLQPQLPSAVLQGLPRQLVELQLTNPDCEAAQLVARVGALQQLQILTLVYNFRSDSDLPARHAGVWASIQRLRQLDLEMYNGTNAEDNDSLCLSSTVAAGIAAATQLTGLYAWFSEVRNDEVNLVRMVSPLQHLQTLELQIANNADHEPLASFGKLFSSSLLQLRNLTLTLGRLRQLAVAQIALQATQVTQLVLQDAEIGGEGLRSIAHSMEQLRTLCLCDCAVSADEVAAAVGLPLLPALQQLAFVDITMDAEQLSSVEDKLTQARSFAVIATISRPLIPPGFVGAFAY